LEFVVGHGTLEQHDDRRIAPFGVARERVHPPEPMAERHIY
jgi:hypothetical protein